MPPNPQDPPGLHAAHEEQQSPDERVREEARQAVDAAVLRMARAAGAPIRERPVWPGAASTICYADPAAGIRYTQMLAGAARHTEHTYITYAREQGLSWQQIGQALGLSELAEGFGAPLAEVAFEHATGAEQARPFDTLTFYWHCDSCGQGVSDYGPYNAHPDDNEHGHAGGCERQAAAVAEWNAGRTAELEAGL